ncbi:unnamed protein product [Diamesa hyperborea]
MKQKPTSEKLHQYQNFGRYFSYTEIVLLDGLFGSEHDAKNFNIKILNENILLGPVRFRQLRVKKDSCKVNEIFKNQFKDCYSFYSSQASDESSFDFKNSSEFKYQTSKELNGFYTWGQLQLYPGGGFVKNLNNTRLESKSIIGELKASNWIDRGTRVVFIEFVMYNANINKFCNAKIIFEIPPSGGIIVSNHFQVMNLLTFTTIFDYFLVVFEIIFFILVIWYSYEEVRDMMKQRKRYFTFFWNWIDLMIVLIAYYIIGFQLFRYVHIRNKIDTYKKNPERLFSFDVLSFWQLVYVNCLGICLFLIWIKVLKYINFNTTMKQFGNTLARSAKDLLGFAFMFVIVFVAFAQLGFILFGTENRDFRTFTDSVFTLMRTILGDFDYLAIEKANRTLGPIFFICYIFFVFFVLLNMFLAIINDTYSDVKSNSQPEDDGPLAAFIKNKFNKLFHKNERNVSWISEELSDQGIKTQYDKGEPRSIVNCPGCKLNTEKLEK